MTRCSGAPSCDGTGVTVVPRMTAGLARHRIRLWEDSYVISLKSGKRLTAEWLYHHPGAARYFAKRYARTVAWLQRHEAAHA